MKELTEKNKNMGSPETDMKELETYLLSKLEKAIEKTQESDRLSNCLFTLDGYFTSLKEYINALPADRKREKIYLLFNLMSEWEMITKKHGLQYPEGLYAAYALKKKLKKLKKDMKPPGGSTSQKHANKNLAPEQTEQTEQTSGKTRDPELTDEDLSGEPEMEIKQDFKKEKGSFFSDNLSEKGSFFPDKVSEHRWSSRYRPNKVFGLEEKIRFMERLLLKKENTEGFKAMAIFGIPGVGKSTICQVMYNHELVKKHFDIRLWVCLSKQKDEDEDIKKEVVKRILACLGIQEEVVQKIGEGDDGLRKLIITLRLQLVGKRYLIVLDDASSKNDPSSKDDASKQGDEKSREDQIFFENLSSNSAQFENKLAFGLPKGEGSMVMVTTRSEQLAKKMVGEEHVHHLPLLKDEHLCWDIFKANLESDGEILDEDLENLRNLVIKKCAGLPLSASMLGIIMRDRLLKEKKRADKKAREREREDKTTNQPKELRQVKSH